MTLHENGIMRYKQQTNTDCSSLFYPLVNKLVAPMVEKYFTHEHPNSSSFSGVSWLTHHFSNKITTC